MNKSFLDSNICVYAFDASEPAKQNGSLALLKDNPLISPQVIIETYLACSRKLKLPTPICDENVLVLNSLTNLAVIDNAVFSKALNIKAKHRFSFLDSVIVATALNAGCTELYTEDMQHGQVIEGVLKIINPFLPR